jgi:hypothetical protein
MKHEIGFFEKFQQWNQVEKEYEIFKNVKRFGSCKAHFKQSWLIIEAHFHAPNL